MSADNPPPPPPADTSSTGATDRSAGLDGERAATRPKDSGRPEQAGQSASEATERPEPTTQEKTAALDGAPGGNQRGQDGQRARPDPPRPTEIPHQSDAPPPEPTTQDKAGALDGARGPARPDAQDQPRPNRQPEGLETPGRGLEPTPEFQAGLDDHTAARAANSADASDGVPAQPGHEQLSEPEPPAPPEPAETPVSEVPAARDDSAQLTNDPEAPAESTQPAFGQPSGRADPPQAAFDPDRQESLPSPADAQPAEPSTIGRTSGEALADDGALTEANMKTGSIPSTLEDHYPHADGKPSDNTGADQGGDRSPPPDDSSDRGQAPRESLPRSESQTDIDTEPAATDPTPQGLPTTEATGEPFTGDEGDSNQSAQSQEHDRTAKEDTDQATTTDRESSRGSSGGEVDRAGDTSTQGGESDSGSVGGESGVSDKGTTTEGVAEKTESTSRNDHDRNGIADTPEIPWGDEPEINGPAGDVDDVKDRAVPKKPGRGLNPGDYSGGTVYKNASDPKLPTNTADGTPIAYREYDCDPYNGKRRNASRFVVGDNGSHYYTTSHYTSWVRFR